MAPHGLFDHLLTICCLSVAGAVNNEGTCVFQERGTCLEPPRELMRVLTAGGEILCVYVKNGKMHTYPADAPNCPVVAKEEENKKEFSSGHSAGYTVVVKVTWLDLMAL